MKIKLSELKRVIREEVRRGRVLREQEEGYMLLSFDTAYEDVGELKSEWNKNQR